MKNAIAYIKRTAKVEEKEGGLRASFDYYANIERLAKAEKNKALADAIKAGIAQDKVANYFRRLTIYMPQLMKDSFFRMHPGNAKRVADIERKLKELKSN